MGCRDGGVTASRHGSVQIVLVSKPAAPNRPEAEGPFRCNKTRHHPQQETPPSSHYDANPEAAEADLRRVGDTLDRAEAALAFAQEQAVQIEQESPQTAQEEADVTARMEIVDREIEGLTRDVADAERDVHASIEYRGMPGAGAGARRAPWPAWYCFVCCRDVGALCTHRHGEVQDAGPGRRVGSHVRRLGHTKPVTIPTPAVRDLLPGRAMTAAQAKFWSLTAAELVASNSVFSYPDRTTNVSLSGWVGLARGGFRFGNNVVGEPLVAAGMAFADVVTFGLDPGPGWDAPHLTDLRLLTWLEVLTQGCSVPLGVRDALGWLLADDIRDMSSDAKLLAARVDLWETVGLGHRGWMYAAAGFTPTEALAGITAGGLDEDRALAMAALRGAALPV